MNDKLLQIIKNTNAYKVIKADKQNGTLSHAYLLVCDDEEMLYAYSLIFTKLLMCESDDVCNKCRTCLLIDKKGYTDVIFYPQDKKIKVADIDDLVQKSYLKPLENDKKLFVLLNAQEMNTQSQNKLLKTLEEPPKGTHIILCATNVYSLLPTVLSRVKSVTIEPFSEEIVKDYLKSLNLDKDVTFASSLSQGRIGEGVKRLNNGDGEEVEKLVYDMLFNLEKSNMAYKYTSQITKDNLGDFIEIFSSVVNGILKYKLTKNNDVDERIIKLSKNYSEGALIFISEKLVQAEKSYHFNGNVSAISDLICFSLLEGKHKWQKLLG